MNLTRRILLIVTFMAFSALFSPNTQAQIFGGVTTGSDVPAGYCLTMPEASPSEPGAFLGGLNEAIVEWIDICGSVSRCETAAADDILCQTSSQAGTGLARESLAGTGITHTENRKIEN